MGGLMSITGLPGQGPVRVGIPIDDLCAGLLLAQAILMALIEREQSGEGQWVQSSLLQAGIALMDFQAARYLMKGEVPPQVGNDHPTSMPTSAYKTADGYINVGASGDGMWTRLCKAMGRPDLLERAEFRDQADRARNRAALNAVLNETFGGRTSAAWIEILNEAGVPCGPIYAVDHVFDDPQVMHLAAAAPVEHATLGTIRLVNQAVKLSRTPSSLATASPERGEHTEEILHELGYGATDIVRLREARVI
jgi:formyl-CoA transferase